MQTSKGIQAHLRRTKGCPDVQVALHDSIAVCWRKGGTYLLSLWLVYHDGTLANIAWTTEAVSPSPGVSCLWVQRAFDKPWVQRTVVLEYDGGCNKAGFPGHAGIGAVLAETVTFMQIVADDLRGRWNSANPGTQLQGLICTPPVMDALILGDRCWSWPLLVGRSH